MQIELPILSWRALSSARKVTACAAALPIPLLIEQSVSPPTDRLAITPEICKPGLRVNWLRGPPGFWLVKVSVPATMAGEEPCAVLIVRVQFVPEYVKGMSVRLAADSVAEKE